MSESQPEEIKQENPQQTEEKSEPASKKGQFSARGGRGGKSQVVKYVKKGEKETEEVEEIKEHPKEKYNKETGYKSYQKYPKERRDYAEKEREREKITLETVIPEKPKKHEVLKEPSEEELNKHLKEIDDKIDGIYEKLHKYSKEMRETRHTNQNQKDSMPIKDLLMVKISESKRMVDEIRTLKVQFDAKKALIEDLFNKSTKYRQKLKKFFKKDEIEQQLKELIALQKGGNITLPEEKAIIKEIAELEKCLPFAGPLEMVTKEMEEARVEKKKLGDQMGVLFAQKEKLQVEIDELRTDLDNRRKEKDEVLKNLDPIIQSKKEDYQKEIDDLHKERKLAKEKFQKDLDDYYKQQKLIQRIEWVTKIKNRLKREEERKQNEAEEKKHEDEEKKNVEKFNPHQEDINLCDLLINYVQNLLPKTASQVNSAEAKAEINPVVQDEWKKEKMTVIQSKKNSEGDFFSAKSKKKEFKKKEEVVNEKTVLQHQFEVLAYFERLKVAPPLFVNKLEETIKFLKEKKDYYLGLPLGDATTEEKRPENEEKRHGEHKPVKFDKRNKDGIDMNESDFPSI